MATYIPGRDVLACRAGSDTVLMDTVSGEYFRLDEVGGWIWEQVTTRDGLDCLAEDLVASCDEEGAPDPLTVRRDVEALLSELVRRQLLQPAAG